MEGAFWAYWEDSSRPIAVLLSFLMAVTWPVGEYSSCLAIPTSNAQETANDEFIGCHVVAICQRCQSRGSFHWSQASSQPKVSVVDIL